MRCPNCRTPIDEELKELIIDFICEKETELQHYIDTKDREMLESEIKNWFETN